METQNVKKHTTFRILLILFLIILLLLSFPFIYSLLGGSRDFDDIPAILASDGVMELSIDEDGAVTFPIDKTAVYSYASEIRLMDQIKTAVQEIPGCSEKTVSFRKFGYQLDPDTVHACAKVRIFGFLPVKLYVDANWSLTPDEISIKLTGLKYGKWFSLPLDKCAELAGMPEIVEGFVLSTSEIFGKLDLLEFTPGDNVISCRCDLLNQTAEDIGDSGVLMANLLPILLEKDYDGAKVLRKDAAEVYAMVTDSSALSVLLSEILSFGSADDAAKIKPVLESLPFLNLEISEVTAVSSTFSDEFSEVMKEYERKLTALRNNYKKLKYSLGKDGFYAADGSRAESVLPKEWDARIVLQYNKNFNSIVKVSDGSLACGKWVVLPLPKLTDLKRKDNASLPRVSGITVYDLTLAVRMPDGTPAVIFLTAADELGLNVISEKQYKKIIENKNIPVYASSKLISPNVYRLNAVKPSQRDLVCYLP